MGIDTIGTSLLASAKKANKKKEKNVIVGALGNIAGQFIKKGVESAFETNRKVFEQNEGILAKKLKYKATVDRGADIINTQTKISESGKDATQYFYDQYHQTFSDNLKNELGPEISGNERLFKMHVKEKLMPYAKEYAKRHEEGLILAESLGTYEQYSTDLDAKIKKAHPDNIVDGIIGGAVRMLSGKSKAEQHAEVVASIQQGPMSKSVEAMAAFNERYKETKDALMSFDYATAIAADDLQKIAEEEKDTTTNTSSVIKALGDKIAKVTTVTTTNNITGEKTSTDSVAIDNSFDDPAGDALKAAQGMSQVTNLESVPRSVLTAPAYAAYTKEVQNMKLSTVDIKSANEYSQVASIFVKYGSNASNLKDKFKEDTYIATLSGFKENNFVVERMQSKLGRMPDSTSPEAVKLKAELKEIYLAWAVAATEFTEESLGVARTGTSVSANPNKINAEQYRSLTPEAQAKIDSLTPEEFKIKYGQ
tara:strand:- start:3841 stop:5280 length:1440 start_codon:yes stop_codon:yes gene_type:complete